MSYCTDQLLTPHFSGWSTLNGTPGGDMWARVFGGQIGWPSDPLRRVHAGCSETGSTNEIENANSWKARKKIRPTQNTPRNSQPPGDRDQIETARGKTRSTRYPILARFHRSRVCENRPRTAFAISKNDECYTHTDTQTDKLNNGTLYAPRYEEAFFA